MQNSITDLIDKYMKTLDSLQIRKTDILEVIILAFLLYQVLVWIKRTRAWSLLKGFSVLLAFIFLAWAFQLNTILWLAQNVFSLGITALIIVFQPELRRALEQLGSKNLVSLIFPFDDTKQNSNFTEKTVSELVRASFEMGKVKTGALMVIERSGSLKDIERTGIEVDGLVTSQLLINIFEHNTPLHDGAVVIRGNRVAAATCYLPLSDNGSINKALGTRHRAAVGISEVTDSLTIIVSEETGRVSLAEHGDLRRIDDAESLNRELRGLLVQEESGSRFKLWKGRQKDEKKTDK